MTEHAKTLRALYYDPKTGLQGRKQFKARVRRLHPEIKAKDVDAFLDKQKLSQVQRRAPFKGFYKIVEPPKHFQLDIFFMSSYKRSNSNISAFLILVDVLSRKMFVYPLKKHTQEAIVEGLTKFKKEEPGALAIIGDDEFSANKIVAWAEKEGLRLTTDVARDDHYDKGNKLGIVDRAIRTLKKRITDYMLSADSARFIHKLPALVANYNTSEHSSLEGRTPNEAYEDDAFLRKLYKQGRDHNDALEAKAGLEVGDTVRKRVDRGPFDKGNARFSSETYTITEQVGRKYRIRSNDREAKLQPRKYKYFELLHVKGPAEGKASEQARSAAEAGSRKVRRLRKNLDVTEEEAEDALRQVERPQTRSQTRKRRAAA